MGGATVVAIRMGRGDREGANHAFMTSVALTLLVSLLLTVAGMVFCEQIIGMSGGRTLSRDMRNMAVEYLFYYCAFSVPMLLSTCLFVFVRNDGFPVLSFVGMCVGAGANIFLDWLFIFPMDMGVTGAAIASGLGQVFSVAVLLSHFVRRRGSLRFRRFHLSGALAVKICKRGVPEAVSQLTTPVTALCYNLMLAKLAGDIGVSTFSVLSFIYSLANAILSGVAQGLQPLWGNCCGERDTDGMNEYFRWGIRINAILSAAIYGLLLFFTESVIRIFNQDPELVQNASTALPLFSLSFIPMALNLIYTAFLYSTKRTLQADAISFSRGVVLKAAAIFCLPVLLGGDTIWLAPLAAEMLTLLLAQMLFKMSNLTGRKIDKIIL
jgi:putative MATE family efflux protein